MKKILLVEPKRSRKYYTAYPPLGLLKLATYHKAKNDHVRLVNGTVDDGFFPDLIYITSLFTYAYEPVHEVIDYYSKMYKARIVVGGIYATLCADHLLDIFKNRIEIYPGVMKEIEDILPDYSLVPNYNASILFTSRGCIRKCSFCSVPKIEPKFEAKKSIKHLIYPGHKKIILWDNNFLASPYWENIFDEIEELNLEVDFNQGLDARLINDNVVERLKKLKINLFRLAYDRSAVRTYLIRAITLLKDIGIRGREILIYCIYNHEDTPQDFLSRIKDIMDWGVVAYPMRYEPLEPRPKNTFVSPKWMPEQLEMIADARRVIGYGGAFPPYEGMKKKILGAKTFEDAFKLKKLKL